MLSTEDSIQNGGITGPKSRPGHWIEAEYLGIILGQVKKQTCLASPPPSFFEDSSNFFLSCKLSVITCSKRYFRC